MKLPTFRRLIVLSLASLFLLSASLEARSFLWEVQSEQTTVYLLGSVHAMKPGIYPLADEIQHAYESADVVVFETDLDPAMQMKMMQKALYTDGTQLKDHLSADMYDQVSSKLDDAGLNIAQFQTFRPWFVGLTLTLTELTQLGYEPQYGLDLHFHQKSQGQKDIQSLETLDEHFDALASLSAVDQDAFMRYTLEEIDLIETAMDSMIRVWQAGDPDTMEEIMLHSLDPDEFGPIYEALITRRNDKMTEKVKAFLQTEATYFVVVGAGHLVGESGIVEQLKDAGFRVKQL